MIIKPRIRGFICTTTHPVGCEANVKEQIAYTKAQGPIKNAPKRVLVVAVLQLSVFSSKKKAQRRSQVQQVFTTRLLSRS